MKELLKSHDVQQQETFHEWTAAGVAGVVRRSAANLTRAVLRRVSAHLTGVPFAVRYWDGTRDEFGDGTPRFQVTVNDPRALWRIWWAPDPALGEAYMSGAVDVDNLERALEAMQQVTPPLPARVQLPHWVRATSIARQYSDIHRHYDLSNEFFALWLDASRTYSCAYFRHETDSLDDAQAAKIEHVLRKAQLRPGMSLLDIGSGWGALVLKAAREHGVVAKGITISHEQHEFTRAAIAAAGLEERAHVELCDYRELATRGATFDRIVSIGMLEHVGRRNLPVFLKAVKRLLKPKGVCVLHFITHESEYEVGAWMHRYIFPGGYIPSWREVIAMLPEFGFYLIDVESLRRHYARTLTQWAERFEARLPDVRALGFDERFIRMWRLYLRGCAAAFRVGSTDLHQLVFTNGINNDLLMTREHIYAP